MLTFVFPSKFHYDRVHNAEAIVQIETALKTVTGNDLKVVFELDEGIMNWETIEEKI